MRWFAWCLMLSSAFLIGCQKPEETIPPVTPSSGTTDAAEEMHDHDHDHDHAEGEDHEHAEGEDHEHAEGDQTELVPPAPAVDEAESAEDTEGAEEAAEPAEDDSASASSGEAIRFVANKSLSVPGMMCPYSCWPNVKKTLVDLEGVEGVQLAEQPEGTAEGEIKKRVVELKVNDNFDSAAAIAALDKISYESEFVN